MKTALMNPNVMYLQEMYASLEISLNLNSQWLINLEIINKETKRIIIKQFSFPILTIILMGWKFELKQLSFTPLNTFDSLCDIKFG